MKIISTLFILIVFVFNSQGQRQALLERSGSTIVISGAERMELYLPLLKGKSVAVFANQSSTVGRSHLLDTLLSRGIAVKKIFAPEHGFRGTGDAGEEINNFCDAKTGLPVISLYGSKLKPTGDDLKDIDIMVFDLQDVGVRFYTYIASLQKYIEAAIENNRPLVLLDRPNPNGFYVDGPVLDPKFRSFVGMQSVPVVYGMTIGEYAKMLVGEHWLDSSLTGELNTMHAIDEAAKKMDSLVHKTSKHGVDFGLYDFKLIIIPCKNYTHQSKYKLPIKPSPNLPNMQAIYLYPSLCFFEGTVISLGRGTDKPFQQWGNPAFPSSLYHFIPRSMEGAKNPPLLNQTCYGYDLSKIDVLKEINGRLQLKWLLEAFRLFLEKDNFFLSSGGFFNKLAGSDLLLQQINQGKTEPEIRKTWEPALNNFKKIRKKYLLYKDFE